MNLEQEVNMTRRLGTISLAYFDRIKSDIDAGKRAPSVRELASTFGVGVFTAAYHRKRLEEFGLITIKPYEHYGVSIGR